MRPLALLLIFLFCSGAPARQSEAFRVVHPGFNDPKTLVDEKMRSISTAVHLTSSQTRQLRKAYLDLAVSERRIINSPGPKILKRGEIRRLSSECEARVKSILTRAQYTRLRRWEQEQESRKNRR